MAARGISGFIENSGQMRLIVSAAIDSEDIDQIMEIKQGNYDIITKKFFKDFSDIEDQFIKDHVYALGWMLANNRLEIKVAIPTDGNGIMHMKVGIFKSSDNSAISFSGSNNETPNGWVNNFEEFKVFKNWEDKESEYVEEDSTTFDELWNLGEGDNESDLLVIDIPKAIRDKLVEGSPKDWHSINLDRIYEFNVKKKRPELFDHQIEAIDSWFSNGCRGILEMATGTGKTYTALGCAERLIKKGNKSIIVVSCPYRHLVNQWKREFDKFGINTDITILADSGNAGWKNNLADAIASLSINNKTLSVITTHRTLASKDFINIISKTRKEIDVLLIGDEVHGLGAENSRESLIDIYKYRLGLSATPRRWFDDEGTESIFKFFGDTVFEFDLGRAISERNPATGLSYLTPYKYYARFVNLTADESEEYSRLSILIAQNIARSKGKMDDSLEMLIFKRSNIVKNASSKIEAFSQLLNELKDDLYYTIVYTSPDQIDEVMAILNSKFIDTHRFTMEQSADPKGMFGGQSERDHILDEFANKKYQVLVAMKCLDEGVDVPPARKAIILSSSGNSREYIQRIGRVIRRYDGKDEANIYDFIVSPPQVKMSGEEKAAQYQIFEKEMKRYEEVAKNALNNVEALNIIYTLRKKLMG